MEFTKKLPKVELARTIVFLWAPCRSRLRTEFGSDNCVGIIKSHAAKELVLRIRETVAEPIRISLSFGLRTDSYFWLAVFELRNLWYETRVLQDGL